jgi:hypothetical protein
MLVAGKTESLSNPLRALRLGESNLFLKNF